MRVGLLGGSFNPAHEGHLHISRLALSLLGLDQVWWLVSPQNPLKPAKGMADFEDRLSRARDLTSDPRIRISDFEARAGTRYTIDSLRALRRRYPALRFVWLMGADNLTQFPRWRLWRHIFRVVPIAVFARPTYSYKALAGLAAHRFRYARMRPERRGVLADQHPPAWLFLHGPVSAESASRIRSGLKMRESNP